VPSWRLNAPVEELRAEVADILLVPSAGNRGYELFHVFRSDFENAALLSRGLEQTRRLTDCRQRLWFQHLRLAALLVPIPLVGEDADEGALFALLLCLHVVAVELARLSYGFAKRGE
jgi:hypothetical protein